MANVKSLSDLNEGDDDKGGKFNDYYAGGEKSGQLLRGAPEDESDGDDEDRVGQLFNRARQAGAQAGSSSDLPGQGSKAFQGQGHTLGGGPVPSKPPPEQEGPRNHVITFYNNGIFTVDNGPPRHVEDPANARFIESISKGECPEELETGKHGVPVTVNLMRKEEPYAEPEKSTQYFTGTGRTLGGSAGASSSAAKPAAESVSAGEWKGVDESKPTTSLQLRLPDGSRMVARFNHTHSVRDIRRFVRASRPDLTAAYQLMTAFPNKVIEGEDQTLEAAGLLNAVIILKH